jgi:hypothetical protein
MFGGTQHGTSKLMQLGHQDNAQTGVTPQHFHVATHASSIDHGNFGEVWLSTITGFFMDSIHLCDLLLLLNAICLLAQAKD